MSGFPEALLTNANAVPFGPIWACRSSPGRSVNCWNDRGTEPAAPLPRAATRRPASKPPPSRARAARASGTWRGHRRRSGSGWMALRWVTEPPEAVEVEGEVPRRLEALVGVLLQAVLDDEVERLRDAGVGLRGQGRLVAQDRADELGRARAGERAAAGEHLVEHRPQGEDVRPVVGHLALGLLRAPGSRPCRSSRRGSWAGRRSASCSGRPCRRAAGPAGRGRSRGS